MARKTLKQIDLSIITLSYSGDLMLLWSNVKVTKLICWPISPTWYQKGHLTWGQGQGLSLRLTYMVFGQFKKVWKYQCLLFFKRLCCLFVLIWYQNTSYFYEFMRGFQKSYDKMYQFRNVLYMKIFNVCLNWFKHVTSAKYISGLVEAHLRELNINK